MSKKILLLKDKRDRQRVVNAIKLQGGRVNLDSGDRVVIIDTLGFDEKILTKLPHGTKFESMDKDVKDLLPDLDSSESLFLDALKLKNSKEFRNAKQKQKPWETPEGKELLRGSCIASE